MDINVTQNCNFGCPLLQMDALIFHPICQKWLQLQVTADSHAAVQDLRRYQEGVNIVPLICAQVMLCARPCKETCIRRVATVFFCIQLRMCKLHENVY